MRLNIWTKRAVVTGLFAIVLWAIMTLSRYWSVNDPAHFGVAFTMMEIFGFLAVMTSVLAVCFAGVARIDRADRRGSLKVPPLRPPGSRPPPNRRKARPPPSLRGPQVTRHCEARSAEAIQTVPVPGLLRPPLRSGLAMTALGEPVSIAFVAQI
jgi:hypothetical protein